MLDKIKKVICGISALAVMSNVIPSIPFKTVSAEEIQAAFDPETVLWTNNKIENVLQEGEVYKTVKDINPNADKKAEVNVQKPYENKGAKFKGWGYSEYLWSNGYPIGNGRMAGMVAGGIDNEVIQINEDTCWDGGPYGTLRDEEGKILTTRRQTADANKIYATDMTSGSVEGNWKYFRGANEDGTPAEIGSADALVGDEAFRETHPDFANKSISYQAMNIDNSKTQTAVQDRYNLHSMVEAKFLGNPTRQRAYKSFVEVYLDFGQYFRDASKYVKSLDMKTGIVTVEYDLGGSHFKRESFASYPDQAVVTHVTSDSPLDFTAELHTYHDDKEYLMYEKVSDKQVKVTSSVTNESKDDNIGRINVINFEANMLLDGDGTFTVSEDNTTVSVKGGNEATIYVVGATNYVNYKELDNSKPAADCAKYIANIQSKTYEQIKARHIEDFSAEFAKTGLNIANKEGVDFSKTPTEKRVRKDVNGKSGFTVGSGANADSAKSNGVKTTYSEGDNQLATLEFNYGKYMMLSGARDERTAEQCGAGDIEIPMSQPLNLTGKWNAAMSAGWNGKYTININTEMNYWAAQPLNFAVIEKTLIDTFADLAESGSITAAYQYGVFNDRGDDTYQPGDPWVMHHNFDLWRGTQPIDNATAGLWPTGGAWLLDHAWQYYLFNKDTAYLAEVYPYMVGAAKFFTQFLVVDPKTGYLITAASCSPEQGGVQPGPAMDTQLVRNLYDMVIKASEILGKTEENAALITKINEQMPSSYFADEAGKVAPNVIAKNGFIDEWVRGDVTFEMSKVKDTSGTFKDITNPFKSDDTKSINAKDATNNTGHRHMSHLWELFPGTHLSAYSTDANEQKIYNAFKNSIVNSNRFNADGKGWSLAWRINLLARAREGTKAASKLEQLFLCRTAPNLLDEHPDFQIDGNYGATSGIIEMLIQSHDGTIDILPALPAAWKDGQFTGFKARGGALVDCVWSNGKLGAAKITPAENGKVAVRYNGIDSMIVKDSSGNIVSSEYDSALMTLNFAGVAGEEYTINNSNDSGEISMAYSNGLVQINGTGDMNAVLIQSAYDKKGALKTTNTYDVKLTNGITLHKVENIPGSKLMLWKTLDGEGAMEPLCEFVQSAELNPVPEGTDLPEPTPTPEPTPAPPLGDTWVCSSDDSTKKAGDYVMDGMSLLFDVSSSAGTNKTIDGITFTNYISSGDNGSWSNGAASGTALKYVAPKDGVLTVYVVDLGGNATEPEKGKEFCITKEGVSDNKTDKDGESAYYKNTTGASANKSLSISVKAGETYYAYVAGSKGRFVGAKLTSDSEQTNTP